MSSIATPSLPTISVPLLVLFGALSMTGCEGAASAQTQPDDNPSCISYRGEARYGAYGYDHVVVVVSQCEDDATCRVSTNVDPAEVVVRVPAGATRETMTRRGSPARGFTPRVHCELAR